MEPCIGPSRHSPEWIEADIRPIQDVHELFRCAYRSAMSTKHVRTTADLVRFGAGLKIDCLSCGNSRTLDGFEAAKACGMIEFSKVQPRLKCSRCGARESKLTVLSPPPGR